ncbi:MAG: hypothetical protein ACKVW3_17965 [Phycisphaerales bacterium]
MATTSRLTGRTLAMATVALVLACAHAVVADSGKRGGAPGVGIGGVVPATASVAAGTKARSSAGSTRVATFTGGKVGSGGRGGSISTFRNENAPRLKVASSGQAGSSAKATARSTGAGRKTPASPQKKIATGKPEDRALKLESTRIVVRRASEPPPPPPKVEAPVEPVVAAALQTPPTPPPIDKNAFSMGRMGTQP